MRGHRGGQRAEVSHHVEGPAGVRRPRGRERKLALVGERLADVCDVEGLGREHPMVALRDVLAHVRQAAAHAVEVPGAGVVARTQLGDGDVHRGERVLDAKQVLVRRVHCVVRVLQVRLVLGEGDALGVHLVPEIGLVDMQRLRVRLEHVDLPAHRVQRLLQLGQEAVVLAEVLGHALLGDLQALQTRGVVADAALEVLEQPRVVLLVRVEEVLEPVQAGLQALHGVHVRLHGGRRLEAAVLRVVGGVRPVAVLGRIGLHQPELLLDVPDGFQDGLDVNLCGPKPAVDAVGVLLLPRLLGDQNPVLLLGVVRQPLQALVALRRGPRQVVDVLHHVRVPCVQTVRQLLGPGSLLRLFGDRHAHLRGARVQRLHVTIEVLALLLHRLQQGV
mmetsp:Transcript_96039/g.299979  ORF Transcript_96039/g.299979 Transcript_96039/m.299979 type:complete len:389 (+) Transcript_96039:188-1354(+)